MIAAEPARPVEVASCFISVAPGSAYRRIKQKTLTPNGLVQGLLMMTQQRKLSLCLYWHMHQPDYRDYMTGEFVLPWTYLHAIKDYTDMAYHLEQNPKAKATFNLVPVLLDQLEEYARQFSAGEINDPLLALLAEENLDAVSEAQRRLVLDSCFRNNHDKLVAPFPPYRRLQSLFTLLTQGGDEGYDYLSGQYLADLITWYHLSWMGESIRRTSELVARLMAKGCGFTATDRRDMFGLIGELITDLMPRYKRLLANGQIEISTTPHFHPILPLLLDFNSARDALPDIEIPEPQHYPGGQSRAQRHVELAVQSHQHRFGCRPAGVWPAEGSVSEATLMLLSRQGFAWAATGENVLANSLRHAYGQGALREDRDYLYKPYRFSDSTGSILCFFRDDRLSDKIGFEYSKWFARDAINDFIHELEQIWQRHPEGEAPVVSIILDGENAWEYYPYNAFYFLSELYAELAAHPYIEMSTLSEVASRCNDAAGDEQSLESTNVHGANITPERLPGIVAGSWVYGNFSTWVGDPAKNRAWALLCEAKQYYDMVMADGRLSKDEKATAERQLGDCEGSDWFWWFGGLNPSQSVQFFDQLYRRNLSNLYKLLKLPVPTSLSHVISAGNIGGGMEAGGTMRRGQAE
jgi:alpha-amylase/alpha-mannosidase (GH57 family)